VWVSVGVSGRVCVYRESEPAELRASARARATARARASQPARASQSQRKSAPEPAPELERGVGDKNEKQRKSTGVKASTVPGRLS
jgi:hypothetical protein